MQKGVVNRYGFKDPIKSIFKGGDIGKLRQFNGNINWLFKH